MRHGLLGDGVGIWGPTLTWEWPPEAERTTSLRNDPKSHRPEEQHASQREQAYIEALAKSIFREKINQTALHAGPGICPRPCAICTTVTLTISTRPRFTPRQLWICDPGITGRVICNLIRKQLKFFACLESVLARNPNHPGAIHLYIHTVELARPELAEAGAERLWKLSPGAGHLVHMPSHIFPPCGPLRRRIQKQRRCHSC